MSKKYIITVDCYNDGYSSNCEFETKSSSEDEAIKKAKKIIKRKNYHASKVKEQKK